MFSHNSSFGAFTDAEDVKLKNPFDPTAPMYSFLNNLDTLKRKEDSYQLRLCYPELTQYPFPCNEWVQSKNPLETTSGTNIDTAITITFDSNGVSNQNFKGLGTNRFGKDTRAVIDGTPTYSNWWFALGVKQLENNKIAGPTGIWVSNVELYMKRTSPTPSGPNVICMTCTLYNIMIKPGSSRRKRETFGGLAEYQEYKEFSVRKKREEGAIETEQETALRSYGSRLRLVNEIQHQRLFDEPIASLLLCVHQVHSGTSAVLPEDFLMTSHSSTTLTGEQGQETFDQSPRWMECNWNQTWTRTDTLDSCVWVQCLYPPDVSTHLQKT